ncbi:sterol desaturase family protein [Rhodobacteraceae bacterium NNCM2]|nr:sterol desaturase family protein [Coraliihabitans acroporae]
MLADFAALFALIYLAHLGAYFGLGAALSRLNRASPDRRIQTRRRGEARARVEIATSIRALIPISALMAGGIAAQWHGYGLFAPLPLGLWSGAALLLATLVAYDAWFYWAHRLMHWRPLYRFHRVHHRSVAPTPWSTYSDHPVDAAVHQLFLLLLPVLTPVPVEILIAHRLIDHVNGQIGHAGFEYFAGPVARLPSPGLCTTFHDLHHARFTCNFGNYLSIWDRIMGTISADYDDRVRQAEDRVRPDALR